MGRKKKPQPLHELSYNVLSEAEAEAFVDTHDKEQVRAELVLLFRTIKRLEKDREEQETVIVEQLKRIDELEGENKLLEEAEAELADLIGASGAEIVEHAREVLRSLDRDDDFTAALELERMRKLFNGQESGNAKCLAPARLV